MMLGARTAAWAKSSVPDIVFPTDGLVLYYDGILNAGDHHDETSDIIIPVIGDVILRKTNTNDDFHIEEKAFVFKHGSCRGESKDYIKSLLNHDHTLVSSVLCHRTSAGGTTFAGVNDGTYDRDKSLGCFWVYNSAYYSTVGSYKFYSYGYIPFVTFSEYDNSTNSTRIFFDNNKASNENMQPNFLSSYADSVFIGNIYRNTPSEWQKTNCFLIYNRVLANDEKLSIYNAVIDRFFVNKTT